jgi:general secretion pathway protein F
MPIYRYTALSKSSERIKGVLEAQSELEAKRQLRLQGLMITSLVIEDVSGSKVKMSTDALSLFTVQLSQLLSAGLPLFESLISLEEQYRGESFHPIIVSLCDQIKSGNPLSAAMARHPESFDTLYRSMIEAGEASGSLEAILDRLAEFLTKQMALRQQITTALIYPGILAAFALVVISMLLGFVVPSIEGIFAGRELNGFTQLIMNASYIFVNYWWLILLIVGGTSYGVYYKLKTPEGKAWKETISLKIPMIRSLTLQASLSRFSRTMATLLKGGLNLIEALKLSRGVIQNHVLEKILENVEHEVIQGKSLSSQLARHPIIPTMVARMLAVGEEAGSTDLMWNKIAELYERDLDKTLNRVMALAQPVILIIMGFLIGSVLIGVLLPLTDITNIGG